MALIIIEVPDSEIAEVEDWKALVKKPVSIQLTATLKNGKEVQAEFEFTKVSIAK